MRIGSLKYLILTAHLRKTVYSNLDAVLLTDRIGRCTQRAYDAMDQLAFEIDPLGRKTQYAWCTCGSLATLTDPNGHVTTLNHDLEGRVVQKDLSRPKAPVIFRTIWLDASKQEPML